MSEKEGPIFFWPLASPRREASLFKLAPEEFLRGFFLWVMGMDHARLIFVFLPGAISAKTPPKNTLMR